MNGKPHKRFPWLWYMLALFVIVAFAFAPIGSVMLCAAIANAIPGGLVTFASWLIFLILHRRLAKTYLAGIPPPIPPPPATA